MVTGALVVKTEQNRTERDGMDDVGRYSYVFAPALDMDGARTKVVDP
jgi:hypothetical protein